MAKVKGTNLISAVKLMRRNREQALAALPPALHHYLGERILPTTLYPEADLVELIRVLAVLLRDVPGDVHELMGRTLVREHMEGVYEHLLKGEPLMLARRVTTLWQAQHDTGRLVLVQGGRGCARYELSDFGHPSREMCAVVRGYILEALTHSGCASLEVVKAGCVLDGRDRCTWECTWEEPAA